MIDDICFVPEVGKLYYGKVVRILPIGAHFQIFFNRHSRKNAAAFGALNKAGLDNLVGSHARDVVVHELNLAASGLE